MIFGPCVYLNNTLLFIIVLHNILELFKCRNCIISLAAVPAKGRQQLGYSSFMSCREVKENIDKVKHAALNRKL